MTTPHPDAADATVVLSPGRTLDFRNAIEFRWLAEDHIRCGKRNFVIDLSVTDSLDSTGIGCLLVLFRRLSALGGRVALAEASGPVAFSLKVARLDSVLGSYTSVDQALVSVA